MKKAHAQGEEAQKKILKSLLANGVVGSGRQVPSSKSGGGYAIDLVSFNCTKWSSFVAVINGIGNDVG
eukprot:4520771-Prorocentrum_lima.AAC.1